MAHNEHKAHAPAHKELELPIMVTGPVELGRLIRELGDIDEALLQLGLRESGTTTKMPQTSRLMDQLIELNKCNLLQEKERTRLKTFLETVRVQAPIIHMSFSADPSAVFLEKLVAWLRQEIHPQVLLTVGLQPNIGAGCIVRTTNKQFDLSLKQDFAKKRDLLRQSLKASAHNEVTA